MNTILLQQTTGGGLESIFMIVALIAIFYFFMIRPQQKRQKEIRKFRESITKGTNVVTAGGIHGKVTDITENYFLVEIASGVRVRVEKTMVYGAAADAQQDSANQNQQN